MPAICKYLVLPLVFPILISCQNQDKENSQNLIAKLEKAENSKNAESLNTIFADDVTLYTPDLIPAIGKSGVISIFQYVFSNGNVESVKYITDSILNIENKHIEIGRNITKRSGQQADTNRFKAIFEKKGDVSIITELSYGVEESLKREIPQLPKPTGNYKIGQSTHYFDKMKSGNDRILAFQIWYPIQSGSDKKAIYQSAEVVKGSAKFLEIPLFMISYFSKIESNSFVNAVSIQNKKFPVLLYNHGYGGFTSVYQTVFEDLASHGYIVVSIAHEDESALFIKEDGQVNTNSPENDFYQIRETELGGSTIGEYQSVILNSDNTDNNTAAYKKLIELSPLHNESTKLWESDTRATIDKLKELVQNDARFKDAFDFELIGVFGHSLGGATAGQLGMGNGLISAGINLDGFQFGDLIDNKLKVPFMFVSSNQEGDRYLRASTFIENSEAECYQVAIQGFNHGSFTDLEYFFQGNDEIIELQRDLIRNFFDKYLKNENLKLEDLESKYDNLIIKKIKQL